MHVYIYIHICIHISPRSAVRCLDLSHRAVSAGSPGLKGDLFPMSPTSSLMGRTRAQWFLRGVVLEPSHPGLSSFGARKFAEIHSQTAQEHERTSKT